MEKISKPIKVGGFWRIKRHDGIIVGWYATRELAQQEINKQAWLQ